MNVINLSTWILSDTHFFDNSPELEGLRPAGWQNTLVANWNALVKPEETVLHLGDLSLGSGDELRGLVPGLPGRIILLRGNHDKLPAEFYLSVGIQIVEKPIDLLLEFRRTKLWLSFSHEPDPERLPGILNIHGHTHGRSDVQPNKSGFFDASVEAIGYQPIKLEDILQRSL